MSVRKQYILSGYFLNFNFFILKIQDKNIFCIKHVIAKLQDTAGRLGVARCFGVRTVETTVVQVVVVVVTTTGTRRPDVVRIAITRGTNADTAVVASGRTIATVVVTKFYKG